MRRLYARYFADGFEGHTYDIPAWQKVHQIPDEELWNERMYLKNKLVKHIRRRYSDPNQVRLDSPRQMIQIIEGIKPDVLTIGFARRFATYKRAYLLFTNLDRLSAIVNNKERPVQFIFAGKAHPNDKPGQDLIKRIVEVAAMPQFVGKILFLQNYDMEPGPPHGAGRGRVAQHPDPSARSVGYVGREVRHERRAPVLGTRRMVGRRLQGGCGMDAAHGTHVRRSGLSGRALTPR